MPNKTNSSENVERPARIDKSMQILAGIKRYIIRRLRGTFKTITLYKLFMFLSCLYILPFDIVDS